MRYNILLIFSVLLFITAYSSAAENKIFKLPSGKEIKVLGVGKIHFTESSPALTLKYETKISIDNFDLLRKEVEEIWAMFRGDAHKSGLTNAIIMATSPPIKKALIFSKSKSQNFLTTKKENGTWEMIDWKRDYENEVKDISESYLEANKKLDTVNMAKAFHYPSSLTQEQLKEKTADNSKFLKSLVDKLGAIDSFKQGNSQMETLYLNLSGATKEYWKKYPMFKRAIYEVNFSKKGRGFLIFGFSIIEDKMVIHSIFYALPKENPEAELVFKELKEDIASLIKK